VYPPHNTLGVTVVRVAAGVGGRFLGGSCSLLVPVILGGSYPRWQFSGWQFSGWQFSGWQLS